MHTIQHVPRIDKPEKESIHSGQFMVSHFEAEEQDDEDNVAVPIPEVTGDLKEEEPIKKEMGMLEYVKIQCNQQLGIDNSLSKLFQCMSLAYRQKLTSPKWNRFRGIRLRWKDKIRLNNVIWRCWHLQFIRKENTLICQFASPLDVDTHNKPEAVVLEGKYWKRKLAAVTAEYKKWRMFYRNHALGHAAKDTSDMLDMDLLVWDSNSSDNMMMVDEDYMGLMSDTLFTTITNQPFVFPDSREIAKAGLAEFIQPSLGPLQPNLDDYMDTMDPFQEFMNHRLPPVPEEQSDTYFKSHSWTYLDDHSSVNTISQPQMVQYQQLCPVQQNTINKQEESQHSMQQTNFGNMLMQPTVEQYVAQQSQEQQQQAPSYPSTVISKSAKPIKPSTIRSKLNQQHDLYQKPVDAMYQTYQSQAVLTNDQIPLQTDVTQQQQAQQQSHATVQEQLYHKITGQQQPLVQQDNVMQPQTHFKMPQSSPNARQSNQGYKFPPPTSNPNIKFTTQVQQHMHHGGYPPPHTPYNTSSSSISSASNTSASSSPHHIVKQEKPEPKRRASSRGRQRSRSNTREPNKRPPLLSAVSDPQLLNPTNSLLLTQLLASRDSPNHVYNRSQSTGSEVSTQIRIKEEKPRPIPILPTPSLKTLIIGTAEPMINVSMGQASSSLVDPLSLNTFSNSNSPIMDVSSQPLNSPTSSQGSTGSPNRDSQRDRRAGHIHAEQKRRYNIKNGFDMIYSLIPHLNQNSGINPMPKLSKAAMLQKGAEYIRQLKSERNQLKEEMDMLKQEIESLNSSISNCQSMLPATGAPVSRRKDNKMQEMFDEHVRTRTMENWKYWIFSLIFRPLLNSFNNFVTTTSLDDLYRSTMIWIEQHCSLVDLRPVVLNSLTNLCTITEVLSDPEKLPEEAKQMVQKGKENNQ